ncbi:hypothetical protein H4R19_002706 [Coemansia spiralis]|nr:hypothetical protein H4R19_002706 [Coemansia spiralis]
MIFDMDPDDGAPARPRPGDTARSPIVLPSLSHASSRVGTPRAGSPAPPAQRRPSVSADVLSMLERQLDDARIDSDYEDIADNMHVEVPIVEEFVSDSVCEAAAPPCCSTAEDSGVCSPLETGAAEGALPVRPRVTVDDFDVLKLIGKGGYGKVYLVQHKQTGRHYAMKVLGKASILLQRRQITFTMTERSILSEVQHPFIVKLFYAFQSNSKLYLIMEYVAGGELFTHMANERIFSEDQASFYAAELVLAIAHLHRLGIVFRDTKPENCLLSRTGHLVLTDFGLSKTALGEDGRTSTFCGTPAYMAPEVLESSTSYDLSIDWWSLGILLYEMLTGEVPFKGKAPLQIAKNIAKMKVHYPNYITPDAKDLIIRLLRKQPAKRIGFGPRGIENIKNHRFFRKIDWARLETDYESFTPPIVPCVSGDADVSNFALEFTEQQVPSSIAAHDSAAAAAAAAAATAAAAPGEVAADPATAFQGFSFVANSVMDSVG